MNSRETASTVLFRELHHYKKGLSRAAQQKCQLLFQIFTCAFFLSFADVAVTFLGCFAKLVKWAINMNIFRLADKLSYREPLSTLLGNRAACLNKIGDCAGSVKDCCAALELVPQAIKPLLRRAAAYEASEK